MGRGASAGAWLGGASLRGGPTRVSGVDSVERVRDTARAVSQGQRAVCPASCDTRIAPPRQRSDIEPG